MEVSQFNTITSLITGRKCEIITDVIELNDCYKVKVEEGFNLWFEFKTGKSYDNLINTFITQFCSKYKEQLPKYKGKRFYDLSHHMLSKYDLMDSIKLNFASDTFIEQYSRVGFYSTHYGIGIFSFLLSDIHLNMVSQKLNNLLNESNIKFHNEFSDKRWVFRWVINIDKNVHSSLIKSLNSVLPL